MFVYVVCEYHGYMVEHYDEIRPNLVRSYVSDFIEGVVVEK